MEQNTTISAHLFLQAYKVQGENSLWSKKTVVSSLHLPSPGAAGGQSHQGKEEAAKVLWHSGPGGGEGAGTKAVRKTHSPWGRWEGHWGMPGARVPGPVSCCRRDLCPGTPQTML